MKSWTVEQLFPTKRARDLADATIQAMPVTEPTWAFYYEWIRVYRANGGVEKMP